MDVVVGIKGPFASDWSLTASSQTTASFSSLEFGVSAVLTSDLCPLPGVSVGFGSFSCNFLVSTDVLAADDDDERVSRPEEEEAVR